MGGIIEWFLFMVGSLCDVWYIVAGCVLIDVFTCTHAAVLLSLTALWQALEGRVVEPV